jgi:hypothetical protein
MMSAGDHAARSAAGGPGDEFCSEDGDVCTLCFEPFGEPGSMQEAKVLPCGTNSRRHTYCRSCLEEWSKGEVGRIPCPSSSVPECRAPCPSSSSAWTACCSSRAGCLTPYHPITPPSCPQGRVPGKGGGIFVGWTCPSCREVCRQRNLSKLPTKNAAIIGRAEAGHAHSPRARGLRQLDQTEPLSDQVLHVTSGEERGQAHLQPLCQDCAAPSPAVSSAYVSSMRPAAKDPHLVELQPPVSTSSRQTV